MHRQSLQVFKSSFFQTSFAAFLVLAVLSGQAMAQQNNTAAASSRGSSTVPQIIQFNGQFNEPRGGGSAAAPSGTVSITFTLYENEQGGTALWSETQNVQVDAQGHYTALLGSTSQNGLPLNLFTTGQAHWLAVQPLVQGFSEQPRVLLVSAPYALKAGDAETIGGLPPSAFVMRTDVSMGASGTTGIATTSIGSIPSGTVSGVAIPENQKPPSTPANYNVTTGYQIGGYYVVTAPGGTTLFNLGLGIDAIAKNTSGAYNTATGFAALFNNTTGNSNTASGWGALNFNTTGGANTAIGVDTLYNNTTANYNVAVGGSALYYNTTGTGNTAIGRRALVSNSTGNYNTASGYFALYNNTGSNGTATGYQSLYSNMTGASNAATGYDSLYSNTTGNYNAADGAYALYSNTTGSANSGLGYGALYNNTTANYNAANGNDALFSNTTGANNTASGVLALYSNTTGSNNIAVGYQAAMNVAGGNNNIEIGTVGSSGDSGTIRMGTTGTQTSSYIAGIYGVTLPSSGQPLVCVSSSGQLGTANCASSGAPSAQMEIIKQQGQQIRSQAQQIADLQQRLAHLESIIANK
jgi:hypothetical protein